MNNVQFEIPILYNKHYIKIDNRNRIIDTWSDGPRPDKDTDGAICINNKGGYQFRFIIPTEIKFKEPNGSIKTVIQNKPGEENPAIYDQNFVPLYKYENNKVIHRTQEEIDEDIKSIPDPPPTESEQIRADIDFIAAMSGIEL